MRGARVYTKLHTAQCFASTQIRCPSEPPNQMRGARVRTKLCTAQCLASTQIGCPFELPIQMWGAKMYAKFTQHSALLQHTSDAHPNRPFRCRRQGCTPSFTQLSALLQHAVDVHPTQAQHRSGGSDFWDTFATHQNQAQFFQNAQNPNVSHGTFNDVGGNQIVVLNYSELTQVSFSYSQC
jgi:hypothetical protein